jgi:hypothetical protein
VIPVPKLHVAPLWKSLPVITTPVSVCPCSPLLGLTAEIDGGIGPEAAVTVKALAKLPLCASGFVTLTARTPVDAAPVIVIFAVSCVAELNVQLVTMIPAQNYTSLRSGNYFPCSLLLSVSAPERRYSEQLYSPPAPEPLW